MRKLLNYFLLITASVVLMSGGCSGDDEPEADPVNPDPGQQTTLTLSPTALSFEAGGGEEQMVSVTSPTAGWTAKSDQDWCYATRKSTTQLAIGVSYSYVTTERTATVTVTAGEQTATIRVIQAGSKASLTLSRSSMHFAVDGGQDSLIQIHCTPTYTDLKYEVKGGGDWLSVSP